MPRKDKILLAGLLCCAAAMVSSGALALGCDYGSCDCPGGGTGTICCNEIDAGGLHDVGCFCIGCTPPVSCPCGGTYPSCTACPPPCPGSCPTIWTSVGTGIEAQYNRAFNASCACVNSGSAIAYRCANNYYGSPTSATGTCLPCPCMPGADGLQKCGTSTAGSNTTLGSCVMASTHIFSNTPGNFKFRSNCAAQPI